MVSTPLSTKIVPSIVPCQVGNLSCAPLCTGAQWRRNAAHVCGSDGDKRGGGGLARRTLKNMISPLLPAQTFIDQVLYFLFYLVLE